MTHTNANVVKVRTKRRQDDLKQTEIEQKALNTTKRRHKHRMTRKELSEIMEDA